MTTIRIKDLQKTFVTRENAEVHALVDVDLSIESGEFIAMLGPSGCGKTTLLNIIAGVIPPSSGSIEITSGAASNRHDPELMPGFVFQNPVLLPWRTALENVMLPALVGPLGSRTRKEGSQREITEKASSLLKMVGLDGFEGKYPDELSGGMQQRVALARALLPSSGLALMDEPFSALDEFTREEMQLELLQMWGHESPTIVFVTHNVYEAVFLADRVAVMSPRPGRIVQETSIQLPRPRTGEILRSEEFSGEVRKVRDVLEGHWNA